jgi:hypothetical protein
MTGPIQTADQTGTAARAAPARRGDRVTRPSEELRDMGDEVADRILEETVAYGAAEVEIAGETQVFALGKGFAAKAATGAGWQSSPVGGVVGQVESS